MIHSVFILDAAGQVLIEKHYRAHAPRADTLSQWHRARAEALTSAPRPFLPTPRGVLMHLQRDGLVYLASVLSDVPPTVVTHFLSCLVDVLADFFGAAAVTEDVIKDNFVTVYQLLDEMLDHGHPLTIDSNNLKDLIAPPPSMFDRVLDTLGADSQKVPTVLTSPSVVPSPVPWRSAQVKYTQNEVFVDVIETVHATFSSSTRSLSHYAIHGAVNVNCRLSGTPHITMHMRATNCAPASLFEEDVALHHCVREPIFHEHKILSFIPPDGRFQLMSFVVRDTSACALPVDVQARFTVDNNPSPYHQNNNFDTQTFFLSVSIIPRFTALSPSSSPSTANTSTLSNVPSTGMMLTSVMNAANASVSSAASKGISSLYDNDAVMDQVSLRVPLADSVSDATLSANVGTVHFDTASSTVVWNVGVVSRGKVPVMQGNVSVRMRTERNIQQPIVLCSFRIPGHSVAGVTVDSLELGTSETYQYYKGLRCITKAGVYEVRP